MQRSSFSPRTLSPSPTIDDLSMAATSSTHRRPFQTFKRAQRRSYGHHQSSGANVGLPFHGSCSRCHHFHKNHLFTFSVDSTVHTRIFCERCNHPMFGLGRASTQNTLASVESGSTFTPIICFDQSGPQPASQAESAPGTSGLGLLTTITERRSPPTSQCTSHISTPAPTLAASLLGEEPLENTAQGSLEERATYPQIATLRRLRSMARQFKQRFYAKQRGWKWSQIRSYSKRMESSRNVSENAPFAVPAFANAHGTGLTRNIPASALPSATEMSTAQRQPNNNVKGLVEGTADDKEDRHASLRARRRQLTLAREGEIASSSKCECGPECPCVSGSRVVEVDRADTAENIHVPSYLFSIPHSSTGSSQSQPSQDAAQGLALLHMGCHFDSTRRSSSADESSSTAESGPRRIRLSPGSTLWSNGSSVSLRTRRPPVARASSMPVGIRAQHLAGIRVSSHINSSNLVSGSHETGRASNPPNEGSTHERTSRTDLSRNPETPSPERSTSLAILPDTPSPERSTSLAILPDSQAEEQRVNGLSRARNTLTWGGDEVIPAPHRGSDGALPGGLDGSSGALGDLPNREITDHADHSLDL